jgi:DNA-binding SARP family transcriptional activator
MLPDGFVYRARLLDEMRARFDRRLTVVRAGAGFGKTTLLAHAVSENRLDPLGVDAWLQLSDGDRSPEQFGVAVLTALLHALGSDADITGATVEDIVDAVWSQSPGSVCLVLDDVHVLDGSPASGVLAELLRAMPANGTFVVGSRTSPALPVRAMQARGECVVIDESSLAFSEREQAEFARQRNMALDGGDGVPSWPALAVLMSSVGHPASIEYLWEAVLGSLDPERRRALGLLVRFGRVDDALLDGVIGPGRTLAELTEGLPLVESGDGNVRFHDLWRTALADDPASSDWREALARGAAVLAARGDTIRAARCLADAGAQDRLIELARSFGSSPISAGLSGAVAEALLDCLPADVRQGPLGRYLRTIENSSFQSERVLRDLHQVFRSAEQSGDIELATLALWRQTQQIGDVSPAYLAGPEVAELVAAVDRYADDGWPLAVNAKALMLSHAAEQRRDVRAALDTIDMFSGPNEEVTRASTTSRFLALGHPEQVPVTLNEVLAAGVSDPIGAQAVWMRGEVDPDVAWPIARELPASYSRRRLPTVQVPLLGVLTSVALAAGDVAAARRLADDALELGRRLLPRPALFAGVADALVVLATDGDDAAAARFERLAATVPVGPWPAWAYVGAIASVRALVPGTEWLDDVEFGPSVATAVRCGAAIRAVRDHGDRRPAIDLPWHAPVLLRVHVPPPLLCELALAAGTEQSLALLAEIPDSGRWTRRSLVHPCAEVASVARSHSTVLAVQPAYRLRIDCFGDLNIDRSDGVPVADRVRGGRVQQLLACLVLDDAPLRVQLAARIWPDLSEKQAATNLRVTLASLLDAIEPDRDVGSSWFVRSVDGRLSLTSEAVTVDVREFERHVAEARHAERSAHPTKALEHHRAAVALYRGDFMPGVVDDEVHHERLRLQTLAYNACCRAGELLLAKGEPEEALAVLAGVGRIDPLAERARRVEIQSHLALGSSLAARQVALGLRERLITEGLPADRDTERLFDRLLP